MKNPRTDKRPIRANRPLKSWTPLLAADTVVVHNGRMMGKPTSDREAYDGLLALRGQTHQVYTAIHIIDSASGERVEERCETHVPMRPFTGVELDRYVATGSPMDKAGGYGIQDQHFQPVEIENIVGCFSNVMGLPLCRVVHHIAGAGSPPSA